MNPRALDDLIMRLGRMADSPHTSPRAAQHRRIAQRIDDAYAKGSPRAEHWDARLAKYEENLDNALHGIEGDEARHVDNETEISGGYMVDDHATGVSPWFAARYADYAAEPIRYGARENLVSNLRAVAEHGTGSYPTPKQPSDQDVFEMARQIFEDREVLRQRYRQPPQMRVIDADELIRRLR